MEEGVRRWVVDISKWDPQPHEFSFALSLLPSQEHSSVTRYTICLLFQSHNINKQTGFWLLLLPGFSKWKTVKEQLSVECFNTHFYMISSINPFSLNIISSFNELPKPNLFWIYWYQSINSYHHIITLLRMNLYDVSFQDYDKLGLTFPNFNFNVSHHGDYVAIASEPLCLVGIDIVSFDMPQGETVAEFIHFFSSYFSTLEWDNIVNAGASNDVLIEFYRYVYCDYTLSLRLWFRI